MNYFSLVSENSLFCGISSLILLTICTVTAIIRIDFLQFEIEGVQMNKNSLNLIDFDRGILTLPALLSPIYA